LFDSNGPVVEAAVVVYGTTEVPVETEPPGSVVVKYVVELVVYTEPGEVVCVFVLV